MDGTGIRGLRQAARALGPRRAAALSAVALLLWGFVGSLAMGLRTPATSDPASARLWLIGALAIGLLGLAVGFLADGDRGA